MLVPAGAAAPPGPLTAQAVPARAGSRPAELRLAFRTELQCGRVGPGPVIVALPSAERIPASIRAGAVLVNGAAPRSVTRTGSVISLAIPPAHGITCNVIGPGTISIVFTRAAGLGNPAASGTYRVSVRAGGRAATGNLVVS